MAGVLAGLKVLDLTTAVAGPLATMVLADRGVDVTRIEDRTPDPFPQLDGGKVWHRGKRSAVFDFSDTPGNAGGPPPVLWQHKREVLTRFGYADAEIDAPLPCRDCCKIGEV